MGESHTSDELAGTGAGPASSAPPADDPAGADPTRAELEARLAEERRTAADFPIPPAAAAPPTGHLLAELAAALAELEQHPGPPDEAPVLELMAQLEQLAESDDGNHADALAELVARLAALTEREPVRTAEELEQLAQLEQLERAREAYERKVRKIVGPEAPLVACSVCNGLGFDLTGGEAAAEYRPHADYRRCQACDGLGSVSTGSRVAGSDIASCPGCGGRGYEVLIRREPANGDHTDNAAAAPAYGLEPWMGDPALATRT